MQINTFNYVQDNLTNVTFQRIVFTPPKMVKIKKMNIEKYVLCEKTIGKFPTLEIKNIN